MELGKIVNRSFEIAWKYKWLWIFGMFAAGTGFNLKLEYLLGTSPTNPFDMQQPQNINMSDILALYAGLIPIIIIFGFLMVLAKGAIIDSVYKIERGGTFSFSTAFSAGVDNFLKFLGLGIIFIVVWFAYIIIGILIFSILFAISKAFAFICAILAFFISFLFLISLSQIVSLAQRVVVLRNSGILDAISEGYQLFKMYFGKNIGAFFILFAFGIIFSISTFILWLMVNFPINSVIEALNLKSFFAMMAALIMGLPISFVLAGLIGLFSEAFMTIFYIELVELQAQESTITQPPQINMSSE